MTTNQIKDILPIIQAYSEGKTIQYKDKGVYNIGTWIDLDELKIVDIQTFFEGNITFRVKPEPKYVPFETKEECWEEMLKHQPFSWITFTKQGNKQGIKQPIIFLAVDKLIVTDYSDGIGIFTFEKALDSVQFIDGTPFGKLAE